MLRLAPLAAAALALGLLAQCHKAAPPAPVDPLTLLPPETQAGAGTFGCLINGQAYTTPPGSPSYTLGELTINDIFNIRADTYKNGDQTATADDCTVLLSLKGDFLKSCPVTYRLVPGLTANDQFLALCSGPGTCYYTGHYVRQGQLVLTKIENHIAAGRFAFVLYEPGGCDTLHVTNGRFDVRF